MKHIASIMAITGTLLAVMAIIMFLADTNYNDAVRLFVIGFVLLVGSFILQGILAIPNQRDETTFTTFKRKDKVK